MRVLLLSDFYAPHIGGVELQVAALAEALTARGDEVVVATMRQPGLSASETIGRIRLVRLGGLFTRVPWFFGSPSRRYHPPVPDPVVAVGLRRLVADFHPDVVQAHGWIAYSCALGLVGSRVPMILSVRDYGYSCATRNLLLDGRICEGPAAVKCLRHAARVYGPAKGTAAVAGVFGSRPWLGRTRVAHAVSQYVAKVVRRDLPLGDAGTGRVVIIPDIVLGERAGTDSETTEPNVGQLPTTPYIMFVGALQPHKGLGPLLEAYRRLQDPPPLVLIGTRWPDTPDPFPNDVTVIENLEHGAVMRAWDDALFGVAPSIWPDPLPGVVREAMSRGVPVIGTRAGGIVDMIDDGVNGLLVQPGDVNGLAAAMKRLLDDPSLRAELGARARIDAAEFTSDSVGAAFAQLYERAVARSGAVRQD